MEERDYSWGRKGAGIPETSWQFLAKIKPMKLWRMVNRSGNGEEGGRYEKY